MIFDLEKYRAENAGIFGDTPLKDVAQHVFDTNQNTFAQYGIKSVDEWADKDGLREQWDQDQQNIIRQKRAQELNGIRKKNLDRMNFISRAVARGVNQLEASAYGVGGIAGAITGLEPLKKFGLEGYQRNLEEASMYPGTELKDVKEAPGIMKGVKGAQWAVEKAAENIPFMLGIAATGGAGGLAAGAERVVGNKIIKKALGGMLSNTVEKELARTLEKKAAGSILRKLAKGQTLNKVEKAAIAAADKAVLRRIGGGVGVAGLSGLSEAGSNYGDLANKGIDDRGTAIRSLAFGMASGVTELMGGISPKILNKMFGHKKAGLVSKLIKKAGKEVAEKKNPSRIMRTLSKMFVEAADTAPEEFAQESAQEILSVMNEAINDPSFEAVSKQNLNRVLEAGLAGGVVGALFGGTTGAMSGAFSRYESTDGLDDKVNKAIIDRVASASPEEIKKAVETPAQEETKPATPPETKTPVSSLENQYVEYGGNKGFLKKTGKGYVVTTPNEDIFIESGESGKTAEELGISQAEAPSGLKMDTIEQKQSIAGKYGAYDPLSDTMTDESGAKSDVKINYDGNTPVSVTLTKDGKQKTIRDKSTTEYIHKVKTLYDEVNNGEDIIPYDESEKSRWYEEAGKIDEEISQAIRKKPEEEIEFDMYDELANGDWLENISDDEAASIADDLGVSKEGDVKKNIAQYASKWLDLWDVMEAKAPAKTETEQKPEKQITKPVEVEKSKGHVAFIGDGKNKYELYKSEEGELYKAPISNVIDVNTGNRIGRWEASEATADERAKMLSGNETGIEQSRGKSEKQREKAQVDQTLKDLEKLKTAKKLESYDLKKTKVKVTTRIEGTDKTVTSEKTADVAISEIEKRIDQIKKIAECIGAV